MENKRLQMSDLLEMEKLEKPEQGHVKFEVAGDLQDEQWTDISEKMESNEDIKLSEVMVLGNLGKIRVNYFGDHIDLDEYKNIPEENIQICENILRGEKEDTHDSVFYLPHIVAEKLCKDKEKKKQWLELKNLVTISNETAKILGNFHGDLHFYKVTELSDKVAEELGKHKGGMLIFYKLKKLSEKAAENLAKHQRELVFDEITEMDEKVATELAKHKDALCINGVTVISGKVAAILGTHQGVLILGLEKISIEVAKGLGKHHGFLDLSRVTKVNESVVEELVKHHGTIVLNGLPTISDGVAEVFGNSKGSFVLDGLQNISDKAAEYLAQNINISASPEIMEKIKLCSEKNKKGNFIKKLFGKK